MQNVKDFIAANQTMPVAGAEVKKPTRMSYTARSELTDNACAKQLFKLMETKKTNFGPITTIPFAKSVTSSGKRTKSAR